MEKKKRFPIGLIPQVAILFLVGILTTGLLTYVAERRLSNDSVMRHTEELGAEIADETRRALEDYPACDWLLRYWYANADTMDVEYDVSFTDGTETEEKCRELTRRHPELELRYITAAEIRSLPELDQKLFAEIAYSWLITRINEIKRSYRIDYLFCVVSPEPYDTQFFLFSGAEEDSVRGTDYEEVYPLGNVVTVAESQQIAMKNAKENANHLADAGDYVDYYTYLCSFDDKAVFIGMTYSLPNLRADVEIQTKTGTVYAILNQTFLSLLCLSLIFFFVLRPLRKVQKNIRLYRETKDSASVTKNLARIRPHNEIGQLSGDVSDLAREIDDHLDRIRTITAEKERIGTELALATKIQAAMLPHIFPPFPDRSEFDIFASMDPAKEVGGDFYDFFLIDDDHLCMVMADVSGKGIPAALFMMASKIILQSCAMLGQSPAEILTKTNEAICSKNPENMFVTVWLGVLELSTGKLTAANAGHEYPIIKQPNGSFELFRDRHGFVLGGMAGARYRAYELQMAPGAKIFVYTDGVAEAKNASKIMFGTERTIAALNEQPDAAPEQLLKNVRRAVDGFVKDAEQFDDLTMLCLEYKGKEETSHDNETERRN